jgi:hypothetical protein
MFYLFIKIINSKKPLSNTLREAKNLYDLAYMMGYKPNVTGVAEATIDFLSTNPS